METRTGHDVGKYCQCVTNHTPAPQELHRHHVVPLYAGGENAESNLEWVCPTTHANIHELLRAWEKYEGEPPWEIRKYFNPYVRELARRGYEER